MSRLLLIAGNDLRRRFVQPFAWILLALVCALLAWQFLLALDAFETIAPKLGAIADAPGVTDLIAIPLLQSTAGLLLLIVPLITMQSLAGERRAHSLALLLSAGVGSPRIIVGKFLAAFALAALIVLLALSMPLTLALGTELDLGRLAAAGIGVLLYAGSLTAIGIACSTWTAQPALAAAATVVISSFLAMLDVGARLQGVEHAFINWLSLSTHLQPFLRGLVSSVDVLYFLLLMILALALASRRLDGSQSRGQA